MRIALIGLMVFGLASFVAAEEKQADLSVRFVSIEQADFGKRLTFELTNTSGKTIDAIKGGIYFYDQFGDRIGHGLALAIDEVMEADAKIQRSGVWPVLDHRVEKLLEESPDRVTIKWRTEKVAYRE